MARKSLRGKEVVVVSSDDDDDDDDVDVDEKIRKYIRPVSVYKDLETRSKNNPYFLRRCLSYIIKAKKKKKSNSGGTITFNYRDLRNKKILKAEIVEKFSCPFCSMLCGGHGGLRHHLESSHDAFKYEFYGPGKDHGPEVDVSLESDTLRFGVLKDDVGEPQLNPFDFCWKHRKHRSQRDDSNNVKRLNIRFLELDLEELPRGTKNESTQVNDENVSTQRKTRSSKKTSVTLTRTQPAIAESSEPAVPHVSRRKQLNAENESTHVKDENVSTQPKARSSKKTSDILTRTQPEIAESSGKTSDILTRTQPEIAESSEKTSDILTRTQPEIAESSEPAVPHVSRRKQLYAARLKLKDSSVLRVGSSITPKQSSCMSKPMTFEEVMSDADSENEADDHDTLDLNERLRLQRIVGARQEEKRYMYLWNIFVRKQRVIADGHMSWACEEFTKLYKEEMKGSSTFDWWWRLFKIKLWNHGLICANTINKCTTILRNLEEGLSTSQGASDANKQQPMEVDAE